MTPEPRRRLDSVLDPSFVTDLNGISDERLRSSLRVAHEEEDDISYVRRLLHGRLDILKAELEARRAGRGTGRAIDVLAEALGDGESVGRGARSSVATRSVAAAGRLRAEGIVSEAHLAMLPELGVDEIENTIDRVAAEEREISERRHRLHEVIDALESELATRYKDGRTHPPV